jgi:thioredoxin 1
MKGKFKDIIDSQQPVLIDFYADWCQPCKIQAPVLKEIATEYNNRLRVIKIDVDKNQEVSMKYQVQSIPTLILFHRGNVLWRQAGVVPKNNLKTVIDQLITR